MSLTTIKPEASTQPNFKKNQKIISTTGHHPLDPVNSVVAVYDVLPQSKRDEIAAIEVGIERRGGKAGYGEKPREEVCYTLDGNPVKYSGTSHYTVKFPQHLLDIFPIFLNVVQTQLPTPNYYTGLSDGIDILYSDKFVRGGSVSAHKDKGMDWGLIVIYNLGQTRWLRVRRDSDGEYVNVELRDNSLICMCGETFQKNYVHGVEKLPEESPIHPRISINVRFLQTFTPTHLDHLYVKFPHLHPHLPPKDLVYYDGGDPVEIKQPHDPIIPYILGSYLRAHPTSTIREHLDLLTSVDYLTFVRVAWKLILANA